MSLRLRLNILFACFSIGFLVALTWVQFNNHRDSVSEEIEAAHRVAIQMLGTAAQSSRVMGPVALVMARFLQSLGHVRANEIRLYSPEEELVYRSPKSEYKKGRSAPDWFSHLMDPKPEATVISVGGARIEVIPDTSKSVLDAWDEMVEIELLSLGFVLLLHIALLYLLRQLLQPTEADALRLVVTTQQLAENREVVRLIQNTVEEERKRLARELHDELGQSVTAIRLIATTLAKGGSMPLEQGTKRINEIAAGLYDSVHRIVRELRPAVLEQPDLAGALRDLVREWRLCHPDIQLNVSMPEELGEYDEDLTLAIFRSLQEALTNVLKHAGAENIAIRVERDERQLRVQIEDDGSGSESTAPGSGLGIAGMRERIIGVGGTLEAGPLASGGFRVSITVPCKVQSSREN